MVTARTNRKSAKSIIEGVVNQLWGWSPNPPAKRLSIEQQMNAIRSELEYEFRSRGHAVQSVEVRESRDGKRGLVVECIVSGAVTISTFEPHFNNEGCE